MQSQIIFPLKFIKRLVADLLPDLILWWRFYFLRPVLQIRVHEELESSGFANLSHIFESESLVMLMKVMDDFDLERALLNGGQQTGRIFSHGLLDERVAPIIIEFQKIAERYLNTSKVKLELTYFQLSRPQLTSINIPGGELHVDDNKPNIKFFVYMSDVGPLNGPFKVMLGSHGLTRQKIFRFIRWSLFKKRSDLYADRNLGLEPADAMPILGEKGFCFAVDTTAWHMAEPVMSGERKVFVASFNMI